MAAFPSADNVIPPTNNTNLTRGYIHIDKLTARYINALKTDDARSESPVELRYREDRHVS